MNNLFRLLVVACLVFVVASGGLTLAFAGEKDQRFTNLRVLSKSTSKDQLKKIMKGYSDALGVDCDFCHDENDMASDNNEHKKIARSMMKMTKEINGKWFGKEKGVEFVTCGSCHRGKPEPPDWVPPKREEHEGAPDKK